MYSHQGKNSSFLYKRTSPPPTTGPRYCPPPQRTTQWGMPEPSAPWAQAPPAPWAQVPPTAQWTPSYPRRQTQWVSPWMMTGQMGNQGQF